MIRTAILLLALALALALASSAPARAQTAEGPRTFKALNLTGAAATAFKFQDGDSFDSSNFAQPVAHTAIGGTARGLRFVRCNLMNCDLPKDAVPTLCLIAHLRTVTVETVAVADVTAYATGEAKAVAIATADLDAQIAKLKAQCDELADAARAAYRASCTTAKAWAPPMRTEIVPICDAGGTITSYEYTRKEIIE